jgi:hypothetical protein
MFLVDKKLLDLLYKIKDGRFFSKSLGPRVDVTVLSENHDDFVAFKEFFFLARQISDELLELFAVGFGQNIGQGMFYVHVAQPLAFWMKRVSICSLPNATGILASGKENISASKKTAWSGEIKPRRPQPQPKPIINPATAAMISSPDRPGRAGGRIKRRRPNRRMAIYLSVSSMSSGSLSEFPISEV